MYKICTNCVGATYSGWWHAKLKSKELDKRNHHTYLYVLNILDLCLLIVNQGYQWDSNPQP